MGEPKAHTWVTGGQTAGTQVRLEEPSAAWPTAYQHEAAAILAALGGRALDVQHVGSTSVPGLAAKAVIDILLVVADSADEPGYVPDLEAGGFTLALREPDWHQHRLLHHPGAQLPVNLHVFGRGCPEADRMVRFRDRLRADPPDRELYERAKRELVTRQWRHVQDYADAKSWVVEEILSRAP